MAFPDGFSNFVAKKPFSRHFHYSRQFFTVRRDMPFIKKIILIWIWTIFRDLMINWFFNYIQNIKEFEIDIKRNILKHCLNSTNTNMKHCSEITWSYKLFEFNKYKWQTLPRTQLWKNSKSPCKSCTYTWRIVNLLSCIACEA